MKNRDLSKLAEPFQSRVKCWLDECNSNKLDIFVTEGYRTQEDQEELFKQGRTVPGKVVTWTKNSLHTQCQAVDIAFKGNSLYPEDFTKWRAAADMARKHGILWGYDLWKDDKPHFQWSGAMTPDKNLLLNYSIMNQDTYKFIEEDYKPMGLDEMKEKADSWDCLKEFEKGNKLFKKPRVYKDLILCILLGRL